MVSVVIDVYDVICLFNVLDRCFDPKGLLLQIQKRMKNKHSRLILCQWMMHIDMTWCQSFFKQAHEIGMFLLSCSCSIAIR